MKQDITEFHYSRIQPKTTYQTSVKNEKSNSSLRICGLRKSGNK